MAADDLSVAESYLITYSPLLVNVPPYTQMKRKPGDVTKSSADVDCLQRLLDK